MRKLYRRSAIIGCLFLLVSSVQANSEDTWTEIGLYVFATDVSGDFQVGDFKTDVDVSFDDILDNFDIGALALMEHRRDDWMFVLDLAYIGIEVENQPAASPIATVNIDSDVVMAIAEAFIGKRVHTGFEGSEIKYSIDLLAGARYVNIESDIDATISVLGADAERSLNRGIDFVDPVIGTRFRYHLNDKWDWSLWGDIGGFGVGSEFTWQLVGLFNYNLASGSRFYFGARYFRFEYEDNTSLGDLDWQANYSGPVFGFAKRF